MSGFFPGVRPVDVIPGDPQELRWLAGRLGVLADGLGEAAGQLAAIDGDGWKGPAADAFRQAVKLQPGRYRDAATGFSAASTGLIAFAQALEWAQQDASRAIALHQSADSASAAWRQRRQAAADASAAAVSAHPGHAIAAQPSLESSDPGDAVRGQADSMLSGAQVAVDAAAARLLATLGAAKHAAPHQLGLFDNEGFLRAFAIAGVPFGTNDVLENSASVSRLINGLRTGQLQGIAASERAVEAAELKYGAGDMRTLNAYLAWEQKVSGFVPLRSAEQAGDYFKNPAEALRTGIPGIEATRAGAFLKVGGKALGVIGVPINAAILIHGSEYGDGVRGDTDRAVSGLALLGIAAELSPLAAVPGGAIVIGVVLGGVALWAVGNLVYDYRHEIAHAAVMGAQEVWRERNLIADATIPGYVLWDQRHQLAHVAAGGEHAVAVGVHAGAHVISAGLHDVGSATSTAEHTVANGVHSVSGWLGLGH